MKIRFRSFLCVLCWVCVPPWQSKIFDFVLHFIFQLAGVEKKTHQPPAARTWSVKDNVGNLMGSPSASSPPASSL